MSPPPRRAGLATRWSRRGRSGPGRRGCSSGSQTPAAHTPGARSPRFPHCQKPISTAGFQSRQMLQTRFGPASRGTLHPRERRRPFLHQRSFPFGHRGPPLLFLAEGQKSTAREKVRAQAQLKGARVGSGVPVEISLGGFSEFFLSYCPVGPGIGDGYGYYKRSNTFRVHCTCMLTFLFFF